MHEEAAQTWLANQSLYAVRVAECVRVCDANLYTLDDSETEHDDFHIK